MSNKDNRSKAEKLYDTLKSKKGNKPMSDKDMAQLLSHRIIAPFVDDCSKNGGSHLYTVRVASRLIQARWGKTKFSVVIHDRECTQWYVDDVMKYIGYLLEEEALESEENP